MKLDIRAFTLTCGILWAATFLIVAVANQIWNGYGEAFLQLVASIYPGFHAGQSMADVVVGTVYALIDGIVGGFVFAWCYNFVVRKTGSSTGQKGRTCL